MGELREVGALGQEGRRIVVEDTVALQRIAQRSG
jgi:hypothetical protein